MTEMWLRTWVKSFVQHSGVLGRTSLTIFWPPSTMFVSRALWSSLVINFLLTFKKSALCQFQGPWVTYAHEKTPARILSTAGTTRTNWDMKGIDPKGYGWAIMALRARLMFCTSLGQLESVALIENMGRSRCISESAQYFRKGLSLSLSLSAMHGFI